jgi:hypothetical protein
MTYELKKLLEAEKKYGKIVLGVDFDDTIFPLDDNPHNIVRTSKVRRLVKAVADRANICLWTVGEDWSMKYKLHICETYEIPINYVNTSPIFHGKDVRKPHFNMLLDDKAGLNETIKTLEDFINSDKL